MCLCFQSIHMFVFEHVHLCECLCLCGNTGILIMWLLCVSACLSMEKLPLIGLGVSESRIMNQNPVKHWNSTEVHCGYIELGELGLLHCTCALLNSVHWFSLNLNTVHTGEGNLSNIAKCAQCTKYLHIMKTSQRCPQSREVSAPHEPFPAPAAPSVSVEGTVKHPLSLSRLWLLHQDETSSSSKNPPSFPTTPGWLHWSVQSVQHHASVSGWSIMSLLASSFF